MLNHFESTIQGTTDRNTGNNSHRNTAGKITIADHLFFTMVPYHV